jgi:hypothetical protein
MILLFHWIQLLHPLNGNGYQFWSGIGSDFGEASILTAIIVGLRHRNCHVKGCWHLGHTDPAHGWPACKTHHSMKDLHGIDPHA